LKAKQDNDLALIWEALARRFGFVDEPERAMRRFDVRKQLQGETLAVFKQSLRMFHREAWPKTDIKSPEADSLIRGWHSGHGTPEASMCPRHQGRLRYNRVQGKTVP